MSQNEPRAGDLFKNEGDGFLFMYVNRQTAGEKKLVRMVFSMGYDGPTVWVNEEDDPSEHKYVCNIAEALKTVEYKIQGYIE